MTRKITYGEAIRESTDQCMANDPSIYIMGLGVPDPKGIFGTTVGLRDKYGEKRVLDMPVSENGMTGIAIGSALMGMRPIMTHQRIDFMLLALDQIINNAAKWHYMFGGQKSVPLVIRLLIGQGWGQGPQHSQSLQSIFAHIPGLRVIMPFTPYDAKGLLVSSIEDDNPVIFIEHRWLHNIYGEVPEESYAVPIGQARVAREGKDITIVSSSYMTLESLKAADYLEKENIDAEIIDLRSVRPLDEKTIIDSVKKTGRLLVVDGAWRFLSISSEIISIVVEKVFSYLKAPPVKITFPDSPTPTSWALTNNYYPRAINIVNQAQKILGLQQKNEEALGIIHTGPLDVPDKSFTGPF
ncbi:MAG: alpha-ketoacid dehydrogenase subunit beta [Nitrosomonadaceae bacterium]|nr:alpha-ketoacid dehydrogenase subunit beta [Nitrosomonadaceae bacterium]|tara:strand:+ start:782 stop:1843 length:1062 start_codon:yes stop_codon:yes gene_type:complete